MVRTFFYISGENLIKSVNGNKIFQSTVSVNILQKDISILKLVNKIITAFVYMLQEINVVIESN